MLLSGGGSGSGRLNLGMLLGGQRMLLLLSLVRMGLVVLLLMLQPRGISLRVLMLMRKNVLGLRLKHDGVGEDSEHNGDS